ncbi:MAG: hypothetical protein J5802_07645 [Butyrivibrio sp.]|nr:hypothetical protein [Butyrivibrio sp.]
MKEWIVMYRCFCGKLYSFLMLFVFPIFSVAIVSIFTIIDAKFIGVLCVFLSSIELHADYFSYNGVTAKEYPFGIFRSGFHGEKLIEKSLKTDQIRRFVNIIVMFSATIILTYVTSDNDTAGLWSVGIVLILFSYFTITTLLIFLRKITSQSGYYYVSFGISALNGTIAFFVYYGLYDLLRRTFIVWIIALAVLSVLATKYMLRNVLKNYEKSFHEESAA